MLPEISKGALYVASGTALQASSQWVQCLWGICQISPRTAPLGNECLLLSHLCSRAAQHIFAEVLKPSPLHLKEEPSSQTSWHLNQALLSQVPAPSNEAKQLLHFLEKSI